MGLFQASSPECVSADSSHAVCALRLGTLNTGSACDTFQRFKLKTNIIGYDKDWFYFFQRVERNNKIYMASVVKFSFTNKDGIVKPEIVTPKMGEPFNPNQIPEWINELSKHQLFKKFA